MLKIISSVLVCYFFLLIITNVHGFSVLDDTDSSALINHFVVEDIILPNNTIELRRVKRRGTEVEKTSLVIVFDATASMGNDLVQMRTGAIYLIKKFHERIDNPIANYILVVFMDPAIAPTFETVDKDVIINKLNSIIVNSDGSYDFPELSISGLINGLSVAKDKPYVFLFTSAVSTDYYREAEVTKLIQQKDPMITIFHTTEYSGDTDIHPLYYKLAERSNGEVHRLEREDISSVISSLDTMIDKKRVNLIYKTHPSGNHTTTVDVDATMDELTFSISGSKPWVKIFDPDHREYHEFKKLIDLKNVQTIQILNPQAGKWNIDAGSSSANSVKLTAISNVIFSYGFSVEVPLTILSTSYLPLEDFQNILSISVSDSTMIRTLETVKIVASSEEFELPLKKVQAGIEELYLTEKFALPSKPFKIYISGRDKNNNKLERLLTPALTTTKGENPETNLPFAKIEASEDENISLLCHVVSLVPVNMKWIKESTGQVIAEMDTKQGNLLNHTLTELKMDDSGTYVCIAQNSIGKSETNTVLQVKPREYYISSPTKYMIADYIKYIKINSGDELIINCSVNANPQPAIYWFKNGRALNIKDDILKLNETTINDKGFYKCIRQSECGNMDILFEVDIFEKLVVKTSKEVEILNGEQLQLKCTAIGNTVPLLIWIKHGFIKISAARKDFINENKEEFFNEDKIYISTEGTKISYELAIRSTIYGILKYKNDINEISLEMIIPKVKTSDAGIYICIGVNSKRETSESQVFVLVPPFYDQSLFSKHRIVQIVTNFTINLRCPIIGEPLPQISWFKDNFKLHLNNNMNIVYNGRQLSIKNSKEEDSGFYECRAINKIGNCKMTFDVNVEVPFNIETSHDQTKYNLKRNISVIEGNNLTLICPTSKRNISWTNLYNDNTIDSVNTSLFLQNVQQSATYICTFKSKKYTIKKIFYIEIQPIFYTDKIKEKLIMNLFNQLRLTDSLNYGLLHKVNSNKIRNDNIKDLFQSESTNNLRNYDCIKGNYFETIKRSFNIDEKVLPQWTLLEQWNKCENLCKNEAQYQYCGISNETLAKKSKGLCGYNNCNIY